MSKVDPRSVTEVDQEIGALIRARRKALGLPMAHVAAKVGVTQQQFQRYETGLSRVSALMLSKVADALEADAADLMPGAPVSAMQSKSAKYDSLAAQLQDVFARIASPRERRLILALAKQFASSTPAKKRAKR